MASTPLPDPIGKASARLFAMGVEGPERLLALRFLGVLLAQAGYDGRVHGGPYDLLGLGLFHGMQAGEVDQSRRLLEDAGCLDREPGGWWHIRDFAPVGDEVPPADAMAAIARVLGRDADAPAPAAAEASVAEVPSNVTPVPVPSHSRLSPRWVAAPAGIAAAVLVLALVLSGQMQLPGRSASTRRENAQRVISESPAPPSSDDGSTPAPGSTPARAGGSVATIAGSAPSSSPALSGTSAQPGVACPVGAVLVTVEKVEQNVDSSVPSATPRVNASIPPIAHTTASGVLRNTSTAPAVAAPFPVEVTFTDGAGTTTSTVTAIAMNAPATLAPGQTLAWSVVVDNPDRTPFPSSGKAGTLNWRWEDAALAAACRH